MQKVRKSHFSPVLYKILCPKLLFHFSDVEDTCSQKEFHYKGPKVKNSAFKGIIIILGLGFPSLYRILPKGLESDNYSNLWHGTVLSDDGEAPQ